ncbi:MAG: GNAT family N-acetyltransferase [Chloroflexota bacterium]
MKASAKEFVVLREIEQTDLSTFFAFQLDPAAIQMAAFTAKDPTNQEQFMAHWAKILADNKVVGRTILYDQQIAGNVLCHHWFGEPEVSYWLGRAFWGKGIATAALQQLVAQIEVKRPLFARIAHDNVASLKVLQKCGFVVFAQDKGFAQARQAEIVEYILRLD